jgi:hypothetical protein
MSIIRRSRDAVCWAACGLRSCPGTDRGTEIRAGVHTAARSSARRDVGRDRWSAWRSTVGHQRFLARAADPGSVLGNQRTCGPIFCPPAGGHGLRPAPQRSRRSLALPVLLRSSSDGESSRSFACCSSKLRPATRCRSWRYRQFIARLTSSVIVGRPGSRIGTSLAAARPSGVTDVGLVGSRGPGPAYTEGLATHQRSHGPAWSPMRPWGLLNEVLASGAPALREGVTFQQPRRVNHRGRSARRPVWTTSSAPRR